MAFLLGAFVGGFLMTAVFSWLVEKMGAGRHLPPDQRALTTVGIAWALVGLLAAWGLGEGGALVPMAWLYYLPGSIAYFFLYRRRLLKAWEAENDDTFD